MDFESILNSKYRMKDFRQLSPEEEAEDKAETEKMVKEFSLKAPIFTNEMVFCPYAISIAIDYLERIKDLKFNNDLNDDHEYLKTFFKDDLEFEVAGLLLMDGLLPIQAREAYVQCVFNAQSFLEDKSVSCEALYVMPNKRGRKSIEGEKTQRIKDVKEAITSGLSIADSYKLVASKYNKSPDTIRRDFERFKLGPRIEVRTRRTYTRGE